ncbi:MAG: hypothetical protein JO264_09675 [Acidisphaera sp.]|nr:hypothetical protein [Acidisphaera sp.]
MASIDERLKDVLDETRLAMLGTQLLMGMQYRAAFSPIFDSLPHPFRLLDCAALLLILGTTGLLLATPLFHQIAEAGHATPRMLHRASGHLQAALLPLATGLGIDVAIGFAPVTGALGAAGAGGLFVLGSLAAWYMWPLLSPLRRKPREAPRESKQQSLETRIGQVLTELRVILPGAAALFGFQFAAALTQAFARLPTVSKAVHLASLGAVALAVIMLIAPAAYHRIAAGGDAGEGVLRYAVRLMIPGVGLLALGLVGDCYVTVQMVIGRPFLALAISGAAFFALAALLYGVPLASRRRGERAALQLGAAS